ncbi:MAG TPA: ABC transporter permease, partial [Hyphomicrobiaceae bacterium]|nr:ABC transporter permease [Hyphomicrobiaceae bacterium]
MVERAEIHPAKRTTLDWLKLTFVRFGVLPFMLTLAIIVFALLSDNFLTGRNLSNVARQSTYLIIVAVGQMLALLTGGFDLSVGTILAVTSVVGAMAMAAVHVAYPDMAWLTIMVGLLAGFGAGLSIGVVNGIGIAALGVSPFIMTLGIASAGFGIALYLTGGVPVYGLPPAFGSTFGFGKLLGIPVPIYVAAAVIAAMAVVLYRTKLGRYWYAVGGNQNAARLSGVDTRLHLFLAYVFCGGLAALAGLLLT